MAALAYRDDKILARKLLSHPFFCLTPAEPFFPRPQFDCAIVSSGGQGWPRFSRPPEGLVLDGRESDGTLAVSGRKTCGAAKHGSSPRRSSRLPGSRSRVSTEVRELLSGSPSIISISRPSNCLVLLKGMGQSEGEEQCEQAKS